MSPRTVARAASIDDVVPHETSSLTCPNGHTWEVNPASLHIDDGDVARCWAPACKSPVTGLGAVLSGVTAETKARRQLAARLHAAVAEVVSS